MVSVAVRHAIGADTAVEHGMYTSVQTHTDAEDLVVQAIRLISDIYKMEGDVPVSMEAISVRSIAADETRCRVVFYNVDTQREVSEFTITHSVVPSWHEVQAEIAEVQAPPPPRA